VSNKPIKGVKDTNGEATLNDSGKLLIDSDMRITTTSSEPRNIHEHSWPQRGTQTNKRLDIYTQEDLSVNAGHKSIQRKLCWITSTVTDFILYDIMLKRWKIIKFNKE
jgi:hypothetical protein